MREEVEGGEGGGESGGGGGGGGEEREDVTTCQLIQQHTHTEPALVAVR